jgi:trehalose 6-phosphate phosphatase
MTKQAVVVPVPPEAAVAVPPNSAPLFPYPPPRASTPGAAVRKKYLQMGGGGGGVGAGAGAAAAGTGRIGGWVESMRASSPTHARAAAALAAGVDEERHAAWMVRPVPCAALSIHSQPPQQCSASGCDDAC